MPVTTLNSAIPQNDRVLAESGLMSRTWLDFMYWIRRMINQILNGPVPTTQGTLAQMASQLNPGDVGFTVLVSDYAHLLRWTGKVWSFATPGDSSGYILAFATAGPSPATGWHACDGSTQSYLKPDGTLGSQVLPNTAGSWFRQ